MIFALILFIITYLLLMFLPKYRVYISLTSAIVFVVSGILPVNKFFLSVDVNVILMLAGTMGVVHLFIISKMPSLLADIIRKMPDVKWTIIGLSLFAAIISAFIDNVATVLMIVPVALHILKKLKISPVQSVIAIAISSNLQGAATLVGDTTSILLGSYANMDFLNFFWYDGRIGIFWVVQLSAIVSALVLVFVFRKDNQKVSFDETTVAEDYLPTVLLVGMILVLIVTSFLPSKPDIMNGVIWMSAMVIGFIRETIKTKKTDIVVEVFKEIDYFTLLQLAGLFVVIAGITEAGVVLKISEIFVQISGDNLFIIYTLVVWASVVFSAFIDNIPYIVIMLPVVGGIAQIMGINPTLRYLGLLSGATLGGTISLRLVLLQTLRHWVF